MTPNEAKKISNWIEAAQAIQPPGTLAIFIYVRDGLIQIGRGDVAVEMNAFPTNDLIGNLEVREEWKARELAWHALTQAFEAGPTDVTTE